VLDQLREGLALVGLDVEKEEGRRLALLLVVDLTNARPGDSGTLTLRDVSLTR